MNGQFLNKRRRAITGDDRQVHESMPRERATCWQYFLWRFQSLFYRDKVSESQMPFERRNMYLADRRAIHDALLNT